MDGMLCESIDHCCTGLTTGGPDGAEGKKSLLTQLRKLSGNLPEKKKMLFGKTNKCTT